MKLAYRPTYHMDKEKTTKQRIKTNGTGMTGVDFWTENIKFTIYET